MALKHGHNPTYYMSVLRKHKLWNNGDFGTSQVNTTNQDFGNRAMNQNYGSVGGGAYRRGLYSGTLDIESEGYN